MAKQQWETYFDAVKSEDWKAARQFLQVVSKQDRSNAQIFMKIGDVCQRAGDTTEAIAAYSHAAQLLRMQGFAQKALATYKIALRLDPANPEIISRAEMLLDEFEAARATSRKPASAKRATAVPEQQAYYQESAPPVTEASPPSDWLEGNAVSPKAQEETIIEPELPAEETAPATVGKQQSEAPAVKPFEPAAVDEEWLESAYEAVDTRIFTPMSGRPSGATTIGDDDTINLYMGEKPAKPDEDLKEAMKEFHIPLSERQERIVPEIFQDLPKELVATVMNDLSIRKYRDRQRVIEEGDAGDSMFIIRSGKTRVIAHLLGRELELAVLGEGDIFGEVGFLTGRPRTASVIADGPVVVHEISRLEIEKLIDTHPEIIARIEDFYETRVKDTIRKLKS